MSSGCSAGPWCLSASPPFSFLFMAGAKRLINWPRLHPQIEFRISEECYVESRKTCRENVPELHQRQVGPCREGRNLSSLRSFDGRSDRSCRLVERRRRGPSRESRSRRL